MDAKAVKKQNPIKTMILVVVMALLVLAYFFVINNRVKPREEKQATISPVKELLIMDLNTNYPATPKEVVKLYLEISRCFYAEEFSDEELEELAKMSRMLFDKDLVENQTEENYIRALKGEIATYKRFNRVISSYSTSAAADVEYYDFAEAKWAQLVAMLSIRTGTKIEPSKERFLLRKDDTGHWKIYGWVLEDISKQGDQ